MHSPEPEAVARSTDPATSWAAAHSVKNIRASQQAVLDLFRTFGPMHDEMMIALYDTPPAQSQSGLRTRRKELVDLGELVDTGRRATTKSRRLTIVWGVPDKDTLF